MKKKKSPWTVLIAIALAIVIGTLTGKDASLWGITFYSVYDLLGKLFINALTLIVVPLVSASIITGIARIGGEGSFGRLGLKTIGFYITTSFMAILIGMILVSIIQPGAGLEREAGEILSASEIKDVQRHLVAEEEHDIANLFLEVIPSNVLEAFAKGNMLGLIFFSLLFGYAITKIDSSFSASQVSFWTGIFQTMIRITQIIMRFLPLGVFCLVAKVFAETGLRSLGSVGLFFITVLIGLFIFAGIALPLFLKFYARVSPLRHLRAMGPALITAFSTSSSSASLPITLECTEKRAGVSNRICSLVIPLGTSMNLSGSALYEGVAAIFVAQAFGVELTFWKQLIFAFVTLLTSMGVAGVPSGSLVAVIAILRAMGLPIEGIGLFLAVDRLLDMCRTTVNVFSDSVCAVLVAKSEGETNILKKKVFD